MFKHYLLLIFYTSSAGKNERRSIEWTLWRLWRVFSDRKICIKKNHSPHLESWEWSETARDCLDPRGSLQVRQHQRPRGNLYSGTGICKMLYCTMMGWSAWSFLHTSCCSLREECLFIGAKRPLRVPWFVRLRSFFINHLNYFYGKT